MFLDKNTSVTQKIVLARYRLSAYNGGMMLDPVRGTASAMWLLGKSKVSGKVKENGHEESNVVVWAVGKCDVVGRG